MEPKKTKKRTGKQLWKKLRNLLLHKKTYMAHEQSQNKSIIHKRSFQKYDQFTFPGGLDVLISTANEVTFDKDYFLSLNTKSNKIGPKSLHFKHQPCNPRTKANRHRPNWPQILARRGVPGAVHARALYRTKPLQKRGQNSGTRGGLIRLGRARVPSPFEIAAADHGLTCADNRRQPRLRSQTRVLLRVKLLHRFLQKTRTGASSVNTSRERPAATGFWPRSCYSPSATPST